MSDFLFARPTLLSGFARTFDLFGTFNGYNDSRDGLTADSIALFEDWRAVGEHLQEAAQRELESRRAGDGGTQV